MEKLKEKISGKFWTDENELITEFEELGYDVLYLDYEYMIVSDIDERYEDKEIKIDIIRAGRTIAVKF